MVGRMEGGVEENGEHCDKEEALESHQPQHFHTTKTRPEEVKIKSDLHSNAVFQNNVFEYLISTNIN